MEGEVSSQIKLSAVSLWRIFVNLPNALMLLPRLDAAILRYIATDS